MVTDNLPFIYAGTDWEATEVLVTDGSGHSASTKAHLACLISATKSILRGSTSYPAALVTWGWGWEKQTKWLYTEHVEGGKIFGKINILLCMWWFCNTRVSYRGGGWNFPPSHNSPLHLAWHWTARVPVPLAAEIHFSFGCTQPYAKNWVEGLPSCPSEGTLKRQSREPLKISLGGIGSFLISWVIPSKPTT